MLLAPTLGYPLGYDHGLLRYAGRVILAGRWPYADAFVASFPGGLLLHALSIALPGHSVLAFRIEDFGLQLVTGGLLYVAGRRLAGPPAGVYAACAYAALYAAGGFYFTAQVDGFAVPFLLGALLALWGYWANPTRRRLLRAGGACLGVACLIDPAYALVLAAAILALALRRASPAATAGDQRWRDARAAAAFGALAALPMLAFAALYLASGHGRALADLLAFTTTVAPSLERRPASAVLLGCLTMARKTVWVGALLSAFSRAWRVRRAEIRSLVGLVLCLVLGLLWQSKGYESQYWPFLACLALFAGAGWVWLGERIAVRVRLIGRRAVLVSAAIVAVMLAGQVGRTGLGRYRALAGRVRAIASDTAMRALLGDDQQQALLARYLKVHTVPADSIQLWGAETMILTAADRWSATRFTDPSPLFCQTAAGSPLATDCGGDWPRPVQVRMRAEIVTQLTSDPPRYVVAHFAPGTLAFAAGADAAPDLPELRALLDRSYVPEATFGNWTAYRRRKP
jgi:hypothetical protein